MLVPFFPNVENSEYSQWWLPFAEAGGGDDTATSSIVHAISRWRPHGQQLLPPLLGLRLTPSSDGETRSGVNARYSRQQGRGGCGGVAFNFINCDNTWYYQSHCSRAESGVQWSPSQLTLYRWPLEVTKQIFPPKLKRKKKSSTKPYTKIHCLKNFLLGID